MSAGYLDSDFDPNDLASVSSYDETWLWSARFGFMLLDRVELRADMRVLDVGCGTGFPLFALAASLGPSCIVVGLDPWAGALRRARIKRDAYGMTQAHLVRGHAVRMPFNDASFDLVTSNLGVNNFADPAATVHECARVVRRGGRIAVTTNLQGHMRELYDEFRALLTDSGTPNQIVRLDAHIALRRSLCTRYSKARVCGSHASTGRSSRCIMQMAQRCSGTGSSALASSLIGARSSGAATARCFRGSRSASTRRLCGTANCDSRSRRCTWKR